MRILELEQKYSELKSDLGGQQSKRTKLLKISEYFSFALSDSLTNPNLIEPYIIDLIPDFIKYSNDLEIRGLNPQKIELLKDQLVQIKNLNLNGIESLECDKVIQSLENKIQLMNNWLRSVKALEHKPKIYFPLLEKYGDDFGAGYLETVNVVIQKGEQKFNISPSGLENDEQLEKQIQLCFKKALEYCSQYIKKIKKTHTVYIHFENRLGILTGNSLGAALTLLFIEALLKHYNSTTIVNVSKNLAITGGIDQNSRIIATSKAIIGAKVESVFYSDVEIMCVPKIDEIWAEEKLKELQIEYPKRNLKIIGLTDLNDLLDRRQIVDIRKQKFIVRSGKFVKKNWISAVATVLLAMIFAYLYVMDFDDNPAMFEHIGRVLYIKNQNGKVLWNVKMNFDPAKVKIDRTFYSRKLVDINNDGISEVIIAEEDIQTSSREFGRVVCFDKDKNIIWKYVFNDTVSTFRKWTSTYQISIIDTVTINNSKTLLLLARNIPNFPNAVFKLDLITGKRVKGSGTLWNAGAINSGIIGDFDQNSKRELIFAGSNNGFERAFISSVDIGNLDGQTPAPPRYIFNNLPSAEINSFLLLPHTDYGKLECRSNTVLPHHLNFNKHSEEIEVTTFDGYKQPVMMYYGFNNRLNYLWMDCGDSAQQLRDSLVAKGLLQEPYTNTNEYFEILRKQFEYWDGDKFVNIDERKK